MGKLIVVPGPDWVEEQLDSELEASEVSFSYEVRVEMARGAQLSLWARQLERQYLSDSRLDEPLDASQREAQSRFVFGQLADLAQLHWGEEAAEEVRRLQRESSGDVELD